MTVLCGMLGTEADAEACAEAIADFECHARRICDEKSRNFLGFYLCKVIMTGTEEISEDFYIYNF